MSASSKKYKPSYRKRKAYGTAFRVLLSYYWLHLKSKIRGKAYHSQQISSLHQKNAQRIKTTVTELEGLFIKFGQLISNLSNILPEEFRAPLEALQDKVQPRPFEEIASTIKRELGKPPSELFDQFEEQPLAVASIGQVHRATIGKEQVIVKIQHANIDTIAGADLKILKNLVKLHGYFMDMAGLRHTYVQVRQMIEEELDYNKEAVSMQQIAENLKDQEHLNVVIPKIYPDFCGKKILIASYCKGTKINDSKQLEQWGIDQESLAKRLLELWCKMILIDGVYHADPHPGNILVNQEGVIVLLDFGAVARLHPSMKQALPKLVEAVIRNDTEDTVSALKEMGFLGTDNASRKYVEQLVEIFKDFLQSEVQFDGMNFQNIRLNSGLGSIASILRQVDLREVSNKIRIPKDYILLNRTIVLLVGNSYLLAPELDTVQVIQPYIKEHVLNKEGGITDLIVNTFKTQMTTAVSLPNQLSRYLKLANRGEQELKIEGLMPRIDKLLNLGQQFLYVLIITVGIHFFLNHEYENNTWRIVNQVIIGLSVFLFLRAFIKGMKKDRA